MIESAPTQFTYNAVNENEAEGQNQSEPHFLRTQSKRRKEASNRGSNGGALLGLPPPHNPSRVARHLIA